MTLSGITALSSFTDKAPVSPTYMNAKWGEVQGNFDTLASSVSTFAGRVALGWFNVKEYGATGDGTTDDTTAIRAAITAAGVAGGTVYFPTGAGERYSITSDLRVTSTYPVTLRMDRQNTRYNATSPVGLVIASDISYPIYYTYPANRNLAGGGAIIGLTIWSDVFRGRDVTACIYAKDMGGGLIEDVTIKGVRGGGILTEMFVQATINRPHILYSGTTDRPPIQLGESASDTYVTQSAQVLDGRFEVNSGTTYIVMTTPFVVGSNQGSNTIAFCQFETDSNVSTEWPYIDCDHHKSRIVNCGFNRNRHTHVWFRANNGNDCLLANSISDGDTSANTARFVLAGQRIVANNILSRGATSGTSAQFWVSGNQNSVNNLTMQRGGNFRSTGQLCTYTGLNLSNLDSTNPAMVELTTSNVLSDSMLWSSSLTNYPSISTAGASTWAYDNVLCQNVDNVSGGRAVRGVLFQTLNPTGTALYPSYAFASEASLGWYRSGVSTMAPSYGTLNLATNAVRFSTRTLAASAITTSAANTNVAVNEMVFTVGGASGASLAIHSGGTVYIFNSAISARAT